MCYYTASTGKNKRKIGARSLLIAACFQRVPTIHSKFDFHVLLHNKRKVCDELRPNEEKQPENRGVFMVECQLFSMYPNHAFQI